MELILKKNSASISKVLKPWGYSSKLMCRNYDFLQLVCMESVSFFWKLGDWKGVNGKSFPNN